ncbi:MAG: endonuclease/exonuclease/phosphatase family protein [Ginsengibacter sp.]
MKDKARSVFRTIVLLINLGVIFLYLLVCLVPYIDTGKYWFVAFPGLIFPFLFFALVCFFLYWLFVKSKWAWLSLIVILIGSQQIFAVFSFRLAKKFEMVKQPNTLRIFHWNVEGWDDYFSEKNYHEDGYEPRMMDLIREQNADILCFEEYADQKNLKDKNSIASTIQEMGYPYYFFAETDTTHNYNAKGVIIFSKYPILNSDKIHYGKHANAEHLIYIDIKRGEKTFRVFTTHLQSVRFEYSDYESLSRLKHAKDPGYHDSRTVLSKLKTGYEYRYEQAKIVKDQITKSPYPAIITGDFNDVPNSNTYFTIKGNMQDAFLEKGSFIGRTFRYISPTLRIDYILADKSFKVTQFRVIHVPYSDHYPLEADLQF